MKYLKVLKAIISSLLISLVIISCNNVEDSNSNGINAVLLMRNTPVQSSILYKGVDKIWSYDILFNKALKDRKVQYSLFGDWKCINMDKRGGFHAMSIVLAEQIEKSTLHFTNKMYFLENDKVFESPISYNHFTSYPIDTVDYYSYFNQSAMFYQPRSRIERMTNLFFKSNDGRFENCWETCLNCGGFFKVSDTLLYENCGYVFTFVKAE